MNLEIHFSSAKDDWETPPELFNELAEEFGGFDVDVCASPHNAKCPRFFTKEEDGLKQTWTGKCWMNPPYGRTIKQWVKKASESASAGALVVCLVPARTDTSWWHDYIQDKTEVRFLRGRVRFVGAKAGAPFPSVVVVFRPA